MANINLYYSVPMHWQSYMVLYKIMMVVKIMWKVMHWPYEIKIMQYILGCNKSISLYSSQNMDKYSVAIGKQYRSEKWI
jgi:hypothetical protein